MPGNYQQFSTFIIGSVDPSVLKSFGDLERTGKGSLKRVGKEADSVSKSMSQGLRASAASVSVLKGALNGLASRLNAAAGLFEKFRFSTAGVLAAVGGTGVFLDLTENLQDQQALLRSVTGAQAGYTDALRSSISVAKDARVSLSDTINLTAKLESANRQLGLSQGDLTRLTGTTLKAIRLSGAGAQQTQAAILQFSQFLGSGRSLGGDELRSVSENAPRLARAIAEGLGVAQGALKQLGEEGKLTADVLIPALLSVSDTINSEFDDMPVTLSQAKTAIVTSISAMVVSFEETTGALNLAAKAFQFVADHMGGIFVVAATAATIAMSRFVALNAAVAISSIGKSLAALSAAFSTVAGTAGTAAGSMAALRLVGSGLLALFGGPFGLALTAITLGLGYLATRQSEAASAAQNLEDALKRQQDALADTKKEVEGLSESYSQLARDRLADANAEVVAAQGRAREARRAERLRLTYRVRGLGGDLQNDARGALENFRYGRITSTQLYERLALNNATAAQLKRVRGFISEYQSAIATLGFSEGRNKSNRAPVGIASSALSPDQIKSLSEAEASLSRIEKLRRDLAALDASISKGGTQDDVKRRAQILQQINSEIAAQSKLSGRERQRANDNEDYAKDRLKFINEMRSAISKLTAEEEKEVESLRRGLDKSYADLQEFRERAAILDRGRGSGLLSDGQYLDLRARAFAESMGKTIEDATKEGVSSGLNSPEADEALREFGRAMSDVYKNLIRGDIRGAGGGILDLISTRALNLSDIERQLANLSKDDSDAAAKERARLTAMKAAIEKGAFGGIVKGFYEFQDSLISLLESILSKLPGKLGEAVGTALAAAQFGSGVTSLLGIRGSRTGAAIGGSLGQITGIPILGKVGSILGSIVGGLFKKTPSASVTFGTNSFSEIGITGTRAKGSGKAQRLAAAESNAGSVISSLQRIADQLGGTLESNFNIGSLGSRKKKFTFDPSGSGRTKGSGVLKFEDAESAVRAAIESAIDRGIIAGLKAQTQRLLKTSSDLETAIDKATRFEDVFRGLRQYVDPVGLALDDLNKSFESLKRLFDEAGASADQYLALEELYGRERVKVLEEQGQASVSALKQFLDELRYGSESPLSLRDRQSNVLPEFQNFVDQINSGQSVDQDAFIKVSQDLLNIQRELYGSTSGFFETFNQVQDLTNKAIASVGNATPITSLTESPFGTVDVKASIDEQTKTLIKDNATVIALLERIAANTNDPAANSTNPSNLLTVNGYTINLSAIRGF